jgi:hypothetical protein
MTGEFPGEHVLLASLLIWIFRVDDLIIVGLEFPVIGADHVGDAIHVEFESIWKIKPRTYDVTCLNGIIHISLIRLLCVTCSTASNFRNTTPWTQNMLWRSKFWWGQMIETIGVTKHEHFIFLEPNFPTFVSEIRGQSPPREFLDFVASSFPSTSPVTEKADH